MFTISRKENEIVRLDLLYVYIPLSESRDASMIFMNIFMLSGVYTFYYSRIRQLRTRAKGAFIQFEIPPLTTRANVA